MVLAIIHQDVAREIFCRHINKPCTAPDCCLWGEIPNFLSNEHGYCVLGVEPYAIQERRNRSDR